MANLLYHGDLPSGLDLGATVAVDSETMGLKPFRDRLCLIQLSSGDGNAHLVQFSRGDLAAPRLRALLTDPDTLKIFHFARFDLAAIRHHMGIVVSPRLLPPRLLPVWCGPLPSGTASRICARNSSESTSPSRCRAATGGGRLSNRQLDYAAADVLHLHRLKAELDRRLEREGRTELAEALSAFSRPAPELDLLGWNDPDIMDH